MRLLVTVAILIASIAMPLAAQFQPTSVELPGISQVIELTLDKSQHLNFVARAGDAVLFERKFGYNPRAGVGLVSEVPGHELVRLSINADVLLYDPNAPALSERLPWPGEREFADATDYLVNGVGISTDGTLLRVGHLFEMGSVYFFYDIRHPLSPIFIEKSPAMTWGEIKANGAPELPGHSFVDLLTADLYEPPVLPARPVYRPRSILAELPALSHLVDAYAPVGVVFPVGWSPDGHLGYAQISIREKPDSIKTRDPSLEWGLTWAVQNMVTDQLAAELTVPAGVNYDEQRFAGPDAFAVLFGDRGTIERGNRAVDFAHFGIEPDQKIDVLAALPSDGGVVLQTRRGPIRITLEAQRDAERYHRYEVRATLADGRSKTVNSWSQPLPAADKGGWSVVDVRVIGALASPFEDRIAVIVARTSLTESSLRAVELSLVGCSLLAGYR